MIIEQLPTWITNPLNWPRNEAKSWNNAEDIYEAKSQTNETNMLGLNKSNK